MDENLKQKVKKFLPLIIAVIAILVVILIILFFTLGRKNNDVNISLLTLEADKPIPFEKDNLHGFISSANGKELISAQYTSVKPFYGNYAIVEKKQEDNTTTYCLIDRKGNEKLSSTYSIRFIADYELYIIDNKLYNSNLKQITNDDYEVTYKDFGYSSYIKYNDDHKAVEGGIIDRKGKKVYTYKFQNDENYFGCSLSQADEKLNEIYAKVIIDNKKYGIVNLAKGKLVYDYSNDSILVDDDNIFSIYSDGNIKSVKCYSDNKVAYETSDNVEVSYYDVDNKILQIYNSSADYSSRYSYYDLKSKSMLSSKPVKNELSALESLTGYKSFSSNNKYGVMKGDKTILPCEYDDVEFLSESLFNYIKSKKKQDLVITKSADTIEIINLKNKKVIYSAKTSSLSAYSSSTFVKSVLTDSGEICVYNLLTNKSMTFDKNSQVSIYSNYIVVNKDNVKTYYNTKLKEIYSK